MNQSSSDESNNGIEDKSIQPHVQSQQDRRHVLTQLSQISSDDGKFVKRYNDESDRQHQALLDFIYSTKHDKCGSFPKKMDSSDGDLFVQRSKMNNMTTCTNENNKSSGDNSEDDNPLISMKKNNINDDMIDKESSDNNMILNKIKVKYSSLPSFKQTTIKANGKLSVPKKEN